MELERDETREKQKPEKNGYGERWNWRKMELEKYGSGER